MKRYSQRFDGGLLSELNVTPLIDLAFTLLIIFMITAPLMEHSLDIKLPKSKESASPPAPQTVVEVSIDDRGDVFYGRKRVSLKELELALAELTRRDDTAAVSLRADAALPYQKLVGVLEVIKESGVRLGLATTPQD